MDIVSYILASRKAASATSGIASIEGQDNNLIFNMNDGGQFTMPLNIPEIHIDRNVSATSSNPVQGRGIVEWGETFLDPIESLIIGSNVVLEDSTTVTLPSAYSKAVEQGYTGSENEFYAMLATGGTNIEIGETATSSSTKLLINPEGGVSFDVPEINDEIVSEHDTWSSKKINSVCGAMPIVEYNEGDNIYTAVKEAYQNAAFCFVKTNLESMIYVPLTQVNDLGGTFIFVFTTRLGALDITMLVTEEETELKIHDAAMKIDADTAYDTVRSLWYQDTLNTVRLAYVDANDNESYLTLTDIGVDTNNNLVFIFSGLSATGYFYKCEFKVDNDDTRQVEATAWAAT